MTLKSGQSGNPEQIEKEIVKLIREDIGPVASFKICHVVEKLPKTRSGKYLRGVVKKMYDRKPYSVPSTIEDMSVVKYLETYLGENRRWEVWYMINIVNILLNILWTLFLYLCRIAYEEQIAWRRKRFDAKTKYLTVCIFEQIWALYTHKTFYILQFSNSSSFPIIFICLINFLPYLTIRYGMNRANTTK